VLEKRLLPWCDTHGVRLLKSLDVDALRRFRATWPDAPITAARNLERLRNFFGFCQDARWIDSNPAKAVKPPKVTQAPTLPFEPAEFDTLLTTCDSFPIKGIYGEGNRHRLKAILLLLRHSGLRIRDAATLQRSRVKNGKLSPPCRPSLPRKNSRKDARWPLRLSSAGALPNFHHVRGL
jgi:site-specific recombinase XerD